VGFEDVAASGIKAVVFFCVVQAGCACVWWGFRLKWAKVYKSRGNLKCFAGQREVEGEAVGTVLGM
jgi:hypothetical protein